MKMTIEIILKPNICWQDRFFLEQDGICNIQQAINHLNNSVYNEHNQTELSGVKNTN